MEEIYHLRMARSISLKVLNKMLNESQWNPDLIDPTSLRLGSVPNTFHLAEASLYDYEKNYRKV